MRCVTMLLYHKMLWTFLLVSGKNKLQIHTHIQILSFQYQVFWRRNNQLLTFKTNCLKFTWHTSPNTTNNNAIMYTWVMSVMFRNQCFSMLRPLIIYFHHHINCSSYIQQFEWLPYADSCCVTVFIIFWGWEILFFTV